MSDNNITYYRHDDVHAKKKITQLLLRTDAAGRPVSGPRSRARDGSSRMTCGYQREPRHSHETIRLLSATYNKGPDPFSSVGEFLSVSRRQVLYILNDQAARGRCCRLEGISSP